MVWDEPSGATYQASMAGVWRLATGDPGDGRLATRPAVIPPAVCPPLSAVCRLKFAAVSRLIRLVARIAEQPLVTGQDRPSQGQSVSSRVRIRMGRRFVTFGLAAPPPKCDAPRRPRHTGPVTQVVAMGPAEMRGRDKAVASGRRSRFPVASVRQRAGPNLFFRRRHSCERVAREWFGRVGNRNTIA